MKLAYSCMLLTCLLVFFGCDDRSNKRIGRATRQTLDKTIDSIGQVVDDVSGWKTKSRPHSERERMIDRKPTQDFERKFEAKNNALGGGPYLDLEGVKDNTVGHVKKLFQFEYKIASFPLSASSISIETKLTSLGKERWNCSPIVESHSVYKKLRFLCKRHPHTPLRYLGIAGGVVGGVM